MSKSSEYFKQMAVNQENRFFGEGNKKHTTNKYFTFKHVLNGDEIIINTNNVKTIKGNPVLVIGKSDVVYLKDWQIKAAHNFYEGLECFLVKLNRQYFKPYHFSFAFDDMCFENIQTFDDLMEVAKSQDEVNMAVANGRMG